MKQTLQAGGAAIGAQLRRLSESIDRDAERAYKAFGVTFEQRWFGVLVHLRESGPATVGQLAAALGITHVSVSQTRQSLHKGGLIDYESNPSDKRQRLINLSPKGKDLTRQLQPLWDAMLAAATEVDAEAERVAESLNKLEAALNRKPIFDRIIGHLDAAKTGRE